MDDASWTVLSRTIVYAVLLIIPAWKIFKKVGKSPYWSLICGIPYLGLLIALFILAFSKWPAADELAEEV